jgi:hypothetical protein
LYPGYLGLNENHFSKLSRLEKKTYMQILRRQDYPNANPAWGGSSSFGHNAGKKEVTE